jgi:polyhydroxyalkanoate synthesis regulator phasin
VGDVLLSTDPQALSAEDECLRTLSTGGRMEDVYWDEGGDGDDDGESGSVGDSSYGSEDGSMDAGDDGGSHGGVGVVASSVGGESAGGVLVSDGVDACTQHHGDSGMRHGGDADADLAARAVGPLSDALNAAAEAPAAPPAAAAADDHARAELALHTVATLRAQIDEHEQRLHVTKRTHQAQVDALTADIAALRHREATLQAALDAERADAAVRSNDARESMASARAELDALRTRVSQLEAELAAAAASGARRAVAITSTTASTQTVASGPSLANGAPFQRQQRPPGSCTAALLLCAPLAALAALAVPAATGSTALLRASGGLCSTWTAWGSCMDGLAPIAAGVGPVANASSSHGATDSASAGARLPLSAWTWLHDVGLLATYSRPIAGPPQPPVAHRPDPACDEGGSTCRGTQLPQPAAAWQPADFAPLPPLCDRGLCGLAYVAT